LDQSIDQIDDNALITYNGKTLVDGSKMAKGVATKTSLTNQSLHESTDGSTKLVELKNRNGEGLNIQTTDTLTMSYVIQGRMYTADIDIDENTTLNKVLAEASKPYTEDSPAAAGAYSTYYYEEGVANSTFGYAQYTANSVYQSAYNTASTSYQGSTVNLSTALYNATNDYHGAQSTFMSAYSVYNPLDPVSSASYSTAGSAYTVASSNYIYLSNTNSTELFNLGVDYSNAVSAADTTRNSSIAVARTELSTSISTAASTLGDAIGDLIPYKLTPDSSIVVGKAASGDTVYTANMEKGLTITSASAGVKYQLSGLTFSVQDSQGRVKKSVNAVLDNFTETVRAVNKSNDNAINLQVGTKANQTIRISLTDMRSEALGLKSSTGETINISTQKNANAVINVLDNAIQKALDQQTNIGAIQARLEMTSSNLVTSSQNVQSSESTIRDADMAKEMTEFTRNNVLLQAAQSMLAQANQSSSSVLSLLQ